MSPYELQLPAARRLLARGLDWFLPPLCLGCRRTVAAIDALNLCADCRGWLRPVATRRCPTCLTPLGDRSAAAGFVCAACRRRPPPWERLLAGWYYEPPLRDVVRGLKYGRLEYLAAALAAELAGRFGPELAGCAGVVPVPLHWWRGLTRGYNQAALIARALARTTGLPVVAGLARRRATRAQTGLDRAARRRNLRGAFAWRGARPLGSPCDHTEAWLLVDDVYTTGATLESAARCLRQAGASRVIALVAAATPPPESVRQEAASDRRRTQRRWNP